MSKSGGPNLNPASNRRSNPPTNLPADKDPVGKPEPILDTPTVSGKSPVIGPPNGGTATPAPKQQPNRTPTFNEPDDDPAYAKLICRRLLDESLRTATTAQLQELMKIPRYNREYDDYFAFLRDRANRVPSPNNIYAKYSYLKEIDEQRFMRVASSILGLGPRVQTFNPVDDDIAYAALMIKLLRRELTGTRVDPPSTYDRLVDTLSFGVIWRVIQGKSAETPGTTTTVTLTQKEQEDLVRKKYATRYNSEYAEWWNWIQHPQAVISPGNTLAKYAYMKRVDYNAFSKIDIDNLAAYRDEETKFDREIVSEVIVRSAGYALGGWMTGSMCIIDFAEWFVAEFAGLYLLQDALIDNTSLEKIPPKVREEYPVGLIGKTEDFFIDSYQNVMGALTQLTKYQFNDKSDVLPANGLAALYRVLAESIIVGGLYKGVNESGVRVGISTDRIKLASAIAKVVCSSIMGVFYSLADNYFTSRKAILDGIEKAHKSNKLYQTWGVGPILEFFADAFDYFWTYKEVAIPSVLAVIIVASAVTYRLRAALTGN